MKRTLELKIRFPNDELESLTKKSRKAGLSREGYCRRILNGATVKEAPSIDSMVMLRELKRIGYNLNEVLKKANAIGLIDVPEMRKSVTEIRQAVKSIQDAYTVE